MPVSNATPISALVNPLLPKACATGLAIALAALLVYLEILLALPTQDKPLVIPVLGIRRVREEAIDGILLIHQPKSARPPFLIFLLGSA